MTILGKKQMSEEDIKLNFITPAIQRGWKGHITMETRITDGRINIRGNIVVRSKPKFADYLLYLNDGKPIAVVEAKDNNHSVSHGLQQAMTYAQMMDLPFAYSSNGDAFYEHDFLTGQEQQIALEKFPTQDELIARYYAELNGGKGISALEKKIVAQPYYSSQSTYPPRYYQRNAVNRTVEAIARGQQRLLLVMATGTGKTYTAFQIVYRLLRSDLKKRVLYLADRNILVDQSILQDFAPLEKTIYKVDFSDKECLSKIASHEVNFALYHQMVGQNDEEHFRQIPAEYFDLIIVDECHRGSAKEDSNWRKVLEYFASATQIGMTATPKESEKVSNIDYFGEPVYIYSLKQGIEDGFLAPFKVINITTNIGDGWRPYQGQTDIFGNVIEDRIYNNRDYDYTIILQDRIDEVAREITEYLKSTDRMQKTIVFCASEDHAERMRIALVNDNQDMFGKPDPTIRTTLDEYNKFFRQPMKMLAAAGVLREDGVVHNTIQFSVENMDVLEYIALRERNSFEFLCLYIEKTLKDSGLWNRFETFFELQTKESLQELKTRFSDFCIRYTPINTAVEANRIFIKVLNPLACKLHKKGVEKGHLSRAMITYDKIMYNQTNWRDDAIGKDKNVARGDFNPQPKTEQMYQYRISRAMKYLRKFNDDHRDGMSEVLDRFSVGEKATHI